MPEDQPRNWQPLLAALAVSLIFLLGLCAAGALLASRLGASLPRLDLAATQFVLELEATQTAEAAATPEEATQLPYPLCVWVWHTEPLPDLGEQIRQALDDAGLETVTGMALSFGENCVGPDGTVQYFAIMQTDFVMDLQVAALDGPTAGPLAEAVLELLATWPPEATPGPLEGYVTLRLSTAEGFTLQLRDRYNSMMQARSTAEDATALWETLQP